MYAKIDVLQIVADKLDRVTQRHVGIPHLEVSSSLNKIWILDFSTWDKEIHQKSSKLCIHQGK